MSAQNTTTTLQRYLELIRLLPEHGSGKTVQELTDELHDLNYEVSRRTIERDLNKLAEMFPEGIRIKEGTPQGWRRYADHRLESMGLPLGDALTLTLIEQSLPPLLPMSLTDALKSKFNQARATIAHARDHKYTAWANKVRSVHPNLPMLPPTVALEVLATVLECLLDDEQLDISYLGWNPGERKQMQLHPQALVQRGVVTYLVAMAKDYQDLRLYAVHRIEKATRTYLPARRSEGFHLDAYIAEGHLNFGDEVACGDPIALEIRVASWLGRILRETPLSTDQNVSDADADGFQRVCATVHDTRQLQFWLLSQGPALEVLSPQSLRERMTESLRASHALYAAEHDKPEHQQPS